MNRNRKVKCTVCGKSLRSDNVKRHAKTHSDLFTMAEEEAREELRTRHEAYLEREGKRQKIEEIAHQEGIPLILTPSSTLDTTNLEENMLQNNRNYLDRIELGKQVVCVINKGTVQEESLTKEMKYALDLYRKHKPRINIHKAQLRMWQQQLMKLIATPSRRQVIWICGRNGNEGKSWFQDYVESFYGYARVSRLDLRNKTSNILFALSKRPLQTTDIFLFNDTRATNTSDQNYAILEHIKDGCATSSKYNSTILNFKVPNVLIVFSNTKPTTYNLSRDRWMIYSISKKGLTHVE